MSHSVWRRVRARVHLSLTPSELSNPVRAATNRAFSSLLMRYSPELGGAVVAHIGPLQLSGPPLFVGASPFPHVVAIANLLVFAPTKGSQLLGEVTHVGPDHLGLSVLSAFHAVLPIDDLSHMYRFDTDFLSSTPTPSWKHLNGIDKITVKRQIRFVVSDVKPTRSGLFQIIASLDHTLRDQPDDTHPLGLLPPDKQILLSARTGQSHPEGAEPQNADLPEISKRSTEAPANQSLTGDDLLMSGNDGFGDALMPMVMPPAPSPENAMKRKKSIVDGVEHGSFDFHESGQDTRERGTGNDSRATKPHDNASAAKTPRKKVRSGDANGEVSYTPGSQVDDRSERKKRKREKRKNKKKRVSQNEGDLQTLEGDELAQGVQESASQFNEEVEIRRGEVENGNMKQRTVKQEVQAVEEDTNIRESVDNRGDLVQSAKSDGKKKKKKKKKRKDIGDKNDREAQLRPQVGNVGDENQAGGSGRGAEEEDTMSRRQDDRGDDGSQRTKPEDKHISGGETAVKTEMVLMRTEERTGDVGAPGVEINTEDRNRVVSTAERRSRHKKRQREDDDHRKMKKKRKRSSEGEMDSGMKRKKKKHKKRLSMGA